MSATNLRKDLLQYARSLGFERAGITSADPLEKDEAFLKDWLSQGRAGEMAYMERLPERRARPAELLPGAKSVVALAMSYCEPSSGLRPPSPIGGRPTAVGPLPLGRGERSTGEGDGRVARYTAGKDYHKIIGKRLDSFVRYLVALSPSSQCRTFVDTGPLLERGFAQRAGLGFIGKNTMLITKGLGSWVFLASVITTLDLPVDAPDERSCGECRLCIDACPTEAITAPFELDPRLCIAYLTIEQDGPIPEAVRGKMGPWVFGCDICQEVCPHNTRRGDNEIEMGLSGILRIGTEEEFQKRFAGTAFVRTGREGLIRNACAAAADLGRLDLKPALEELLKDPSSLVRGEAIQAIKQLAITSGRRSASSQGPEVGGRRGAKAILH